MWSKISKIGLPISIKLTILYAVILSCILILTSALTFTGLYYVLYTQADDDINLSANSIANYLETGKPINHQLLETNLIVPGVVLRIFDDHNHLLLDNAPSVAGNRGLSKEEEEDINPLRFAPLKKRTLRIVHFAHNYYFYTNQTILMNGQEYHLQLIKPMVEQLHFLKTLSKSLIVTNAFGLFIAVIAGVYISRKVLRPIRDITDTAKEIEVNDLGKRIKVTMSNDELQELAKTFNHMLDRIQTGFEQQQRFTADASHELRTPITVISGYADMLDRWGKEDPAALEEGISAIKSEAANMHRLIEKLLFLARTDQNKQIIKKTSIDMEHFLAEIMQETKIIAPDHQVHLLQNDPATIFADATYLKEMIRVFIENSIKYTPPGGTISINSQKQEDQLLITIQDTGIGIPKAEQNRIFERFYRVDKSRSKATGGTGLGLSIASWIAEQHNSTIELKSKQGEGTTVVVRIPLAKS